MSSNSKKKKEKDFVSSQEEANKIFEESKSKSKKNKIKPRTKESQKLLKNKKVVCSLAVLLMAGIGTISCLTIKANADKIIVKPQVEIESGSPAPTPSTYITKQGSLKVKEIKYANTDKKVEHNDKLLVETIYYDKDGKEVSKEESTEEKDGKTVLKKGFSKKQVVIGTYSYKVTLVGEDGKKYTSKLSIKDETKPVLKVHDVTITEGDEAPKASDFFESCSDSSRTACSDDIHFVKVVKPEESKKEEVKSEDKSKEETKVEKKDDSKANVEESKEDKKTSKKSSTKTTKKTTKTKSTSPSKKKTSFLDTIKEKFGLKKAKATTKKQTVVNDKAKEPEYTKIDAPEDLSVGEHEVLLRISDSSGNLSKVVSAKIKVEAKPEPEPEEEVQSSSNGGSTSGGSSYRSNSGGSYRGNSGGSSAGGSAPAQASCGSQGYALDYGYGQRVSQGQMYAFWGCGRGDLSGSYAGQLNNQFIGVSTQMIRECQANGGDCWNSYDNLYSGKVYDVATGEVVGLMIRVNVYRDGENHVASGVFTQNGMQWSFKQF